MFPGMCGCGGEFEKIVTWNSTWSGWYCVNVICEKCGFFIVTYFVIGNKVSVVEKDLERLCYKAVNINKEACKL